MQDAIDKVRQFHETFDVAVAPRPTADIPHDVLELRLRLMEEELQEYRAAAAAQDLLAVADALSDLLYVVFGTCLVHGLQNVMDELFAEVHRSNMSKLDEDGQPVRRADGKVLKSQLFTEPDLQPIIERALQP